MKVADKHKLRIATNNILSSGTIAVKIVEMRSSSSLIPFEKW